MKAVEIKKTGGPEVLELKDITLNKPRPDRGNNRTKSYWTKLY
jgi:NADPH:quinone reductase-like Zn-dependent oxidoreductase